MKINIEGTDEVRTEIDRKSQLLAAAKSLLEDSESDDQLTSFTALDSEDFRAES